MGASGGDSGDVWKRIEEEERVARSYLKKTTPQAPFPAGSAKPPEDYFPTGAPIREWRARLVSFPTVFYFLFVVVGVIAFIAAVNNLSGNNRGSGGSGWFLLIFSLLALGQSIPFLIFSMIKIKAFADGTIVFSRPCRQLVVKPGELESIHSIWIDPNRLLPMAIRSVRGSVLVAPRYPDVDYLLQCLRRKNFRAQITDPRSWLTRPT